MLEKILILLSSFVILAAIIIGIIIFFHFKKFSLPEDKMAKKIFKIFLIGALFLSLFNVFLLVLNLFKK
jgi:membrane protein insertase Oxa1/YidC/SpoIIIJ